MLLRAGGVHCCSRRSADSAHGSASSSQLRKCLKLAASAVLGHRNIATMSAKIGKRVSLDYAQIQNEGAALRNPSTDDDDDDDDYDEAPLAPRRAQESSFIKATDHSLSTSSARARLSGKDQLMEKTLTNIKSMSLMFESGALQPPASASPPSFSRTDVSRNSNSSPHLFSRTDVIRNSKSDAIVVPEAPPPRTSSTAQRAAASQPRTEVQTQHRPVAEPHSRILDQSSPYDASKSYVKDLEHRVEQLEELLATMQHRLETVLASQESTKIPSKYDPAPIRSAHVARTHAPLQAHQPPLEVHGEELSVAVVTGEQVPTSDRSGPSTQRSGRRHSIQSVAQGIIFARRLHLPAIGPLPSFDKASCSKGIVLHNSNQAATLMQFSDSPHPYCLGAPITRGSSFLSITLYFGEPALPAISSSLSPADLHTILESGSADEVVEAIISSQRDDLSQALKSSKDAVLAALSKKLGVTVRLDSHFETRCEALRKRCREIVRNAASGGVCFFGVCGANTPSHGIRGNEMVWCSSINQRKDPGAPKTNSLASRDDRIKALYLHIELLFSDLQTICDVLGPNFCAFLNNIVHRRRAAAEEHIAAEDTRNPFTDFSPKQVSSTSSFFNHVMLVSAAV